MRLPTEVLRAMDRVADDTEAASMDTVADLLSELKRFDKRLRSAAVAPGAETADPAHGVDDWTKEVF